MGMGDLARAVEASLRKGNLMHYNSPSCECKPCVVIRQHKAIQAYGTAGNEPIVGLNSPQEETESMIVPSSPTQSFIIKESPPIDHAPCLAHAERNFLWGMAVGGAIVMLVLPTALYLVGALK